MELDRLYSLVRDYANKSFYSTAIFYANKLLTLNPGTKNRVNNNNNNNNLDDNNNNYYYNYNYDTNTNTDNPDNILLLADCYFKDQQYQRASHLLGLIVPLVASSPLQNNYPGVDKKSGIFKQSQLLFSMCKSKVEDWDGCIDILGDEIDDSPGDLKTEALLSIMRGDANESLGFRSRAIFWYKKALLYDIYCIDGWEKLCSKCMLTGVEEIEFIETLKFPTDSAWLKDMYLCKSNSFSSIVVPIDEKQINPEKILKELDQKYNLINDEDIIKAQAEAAFNANDIGKAYLLTNKILEKDPFCDKILPVHISCLVEMNDKNNLFRLSHKLSESHPKSAISWYAVGYYYYTIESWNNAKIYFTKSNTIDPNFGASWLAYGHTLARQGDHDQTMAAYRNSTRLLSGSNLPYQALASELIRTNNFDLALEFALKAHQMQPNDPYPIHELGAIAFLQRNWTKSIEYFELVLNLVNNGNLHETWEPTLFNLGHAYRKLKKYKTAIMYYSMSLSLSQYNYTTYTALGYTLHLSGNIDEAIQHYHSALALHPEDSFASEMLQAALEEQFMHTNVESLFKNTENIE